MNARWTVCPVNKEICQRSFAKGEAAAAAKKLQAALGQFKDARPPHMPAPPKPGENRKARNTQ